MDQQPSPQASATSQAHDPRAADVAANKDFAALSYAWVLSMFVYASRRQSPFARFHAKQGIVLFALTIPLWLLPPLIGRPLLLVVLIGCVTGFVSAARGEWRELPVAYALSSGKLSRLLPRFGKSARTLAGKTAGQGAESSANRSSSLTPAV